jgi:hypothetical protein
MELSNLLIRVSFIALPGIVGRQVYQVLTAPRNKKDWEDVCEIALFSLFSYTVYGLLMECSIKLGMVGDKVVVLQALLDEKVPLSWREISITSALAVVFAFIATYFRTHNVLTTIARHLRVTKKHGDEDIWESFLTLPAGQDWVFVRDHKLDLVYYGWIQLFSDSGKSRELVLREVEVYSNSTPDRLYEVERLYVSRNEDDLSIEYPKRSV